MALYHNGNRIVETAKVATEIENKVDSVPNSSLVYQLNQSLADMRNGLSFKAFDIDYVGATTEGNEYYFSNGKTTLGLSSSNTVRGISLCSAGGNNKICLTMNLHYIANTDRIYFKVQNGEYNTSHTRFIGVVFYN